MTKQLKLYVPVVCPKRKVILVGVHNCQNLRSEIPLPRDIFSHLQAEKFIISNGGQFTSIKVSVTKDRFIELQKELSSKVGASYRAPVIDMISQLGQMPIIQIIGNKEITKNE